MFTEPSQFAGSGGIMLNSFSNTAGQPPRRWNYAEQKQGVMGSRPMQHLPAAAGRIGAVAPQSDAQASMFDETLPGRTGDNETAGSRGQALLSLKTGYARRRFHISPLMRRRVSSKGNFEMDAYTLQHQRGEVVDKMRAMLNSAESQGRDFNASEKATYDKLDAELNSLTNRIQRLEKADAAEAMVNHVPEPKFRTPLSGSSVGTGISDADARSFNAFLRSGIKNTLTTDVPSGGGYTVPTTLANELFDTIAESNPVFGSVERVTTDSNNYHRVFAVSGTASGRIAEQATRVETAAPVYASQTINLSMIYAMPEASEELIASSQYDLAAHVRREITMAFDSTLEAEMLTGNGTHPNQTGILTAADSTDADGLRDFGSYQVIQAPTPVITLDDVLTLIHSLPPRYRRAARLYASTDCVEKLRRLKDGDGNMLWRETDGAVGRPQTLLGYEVVEVTAMPDVAASAKPLMFGDLRQAYAFATHSSASMMATRDSVTKPGTVRFHVRSFCGSGPMDTRALKVLQMAAA